MVGQEISKDNGHQYVHGRRITDDRRDLVSDCNDELSQSSPDDFSLPHGFLLLQQYVCAVAAVISF